MGTELPSSPWTQRRSDTAGQAETRVWLLPSTSEPMGCIIHVSPREGAGLGPVAGFPPLFSILDGAVTDFAEAGPVTPLALPQVSAARNGLHRFPQHLGDSCGAAPMVEAMWPGTCLIVVLTVITRHPWVKKHLLGLSRHNL